ncbi:MAG: hypothetical protein M1827_004261 [Pycnora praestabilis]|nr:MAG: hypothetical protein M1827_004261 [Pycnora praestabilis]
MPHWIYNQLDSRTPLTTYLSPVVTAAEAEIAEEAAQAGVSDAVIPPPGGYIEVPVVYSFRDCAIAVKTVYEGTHQWDVASKTAIKQTAINIKDTCLRSASEEVFGGWQIAGIYHNLNVTVFQIPELARPPGSKRPSKGYINLPSTVKEPFYLDIIAEQKMDKNEDSSTGTSSRYGPCLTEYAYTTVNDCCPGFSYVDEPVTEGNAETFATIFGLAHQTLLNMGKIGWCSTIVT